MLLWFGRIIDRRESLSFEFFLTSKYIKHKNLKRLFRKAPTPSRWLLLAMFVVVPMFPGSIDQYKP